MKRTEAKAARIFLRVREARKRLGMTQEELARKAGVRVGTISNAERCIHSVAMDTFLLIMEALWAEQRKNPKATEPLARIGRAFQQPLKKVA